MWGRFLAPEAGGRDSPGGSRSFPAGKGDGGRVGWRPPGCVGSPRPWACDPRRVTTRPFWAARPGFVVSRVVRGCPTRDAGGKVAAVSPAAAGPGTLLGTWSQTATPGVPQLLESGSRGCQSSPGSHQNPTTFELRGQGNWGLRRFAWVEGTVRIGQAYHACITQKLCRSHQMRLNLLTWNRKRRLSLTMTSYLTMTVLKGTLILTEFGSL